MKPEKIDIVKLIDKYWKFDNYQQHCSSWHDKEELLVKVGEICQEIDEEMKEAVELLKVADCHNCDGSGIKKIRVLGQGMGTEQCKWCFIRNQFIQQHSK